MRARCAEIGAMAASTNTKITSKKLVTFVKTRYKSKLYSWSLQDLEDIDKMFYSFRTNLAKNMQIFLYGLLYLNQDQGENGTLLASTS